MVGADVVVVGGGIVGAACADALAALGAEVVLLERTELAAGASGRNQGLHLTPVDPALVPMARASLRRWLTLAEDPPFPFLLDHEPVGCLLVGDADGLAAAREEAAAAGAAGVAIEELGGEELRRLEPELAPDLAGGFLLTDGHRLDPLALTVALAHRARRRGAEIRTGRPARRLLVRGTAVRAVVTDDGVLEAGTVVLAAGPWSAPLAAGAGVALPVSGTRGWLVHVDPGRPLLSRIVEDAGRRLWREPPAPVRAGDLAGSPPRPDIGSILHPSPDGSVVLGASREPHLSDHLLDPEVPRGIVRRATRLVPGLAAAAVRAAWWGVRPTTPDERPLVGSVAEGLLAATGHGSEGVILAGGTAELVAALVSGAEPPFDPAPFHPARFAPGGGA